MFTSCLNELRLLSSTHFDSQSLLTTIICGNTRLPERFRTGALLSLGTRIRARFVMEPYSKDVLLGYLKHCLAQAGAPHLISNQLRQTLVDHSGGNLRVLTTLAAELLERAAEKDLTQLDEKLYLEVFSRPSAQHRAN